MARSEEEDVPLSEMEYPVGVKDQYPFEESMGVYVIGVVVEGRDPKV